eukprot:2002153-Amphidinium_carterae.1
MALRWWSKKRTRTEVVQTVYCKQVRTSHEMSMKTMVRTACTVAGLGGPPSAKITQWNTLASVHVL